MQRAARFDPPRAWQPCADRIQAMNFSGVALHPDFGEVNYEATMLSDDPDTQVAQTIERMKRNIIEDAESEPIRRAAAEIQATGTGDACTDTFWWVKNRVGFRQDEELAAPIEHLIRDPQFTGVVEVLIRPRDMAQMETPLEDCDGFASFLPALLRAQGIRCNPVTVAADNREPGRFSHVYAVCYPEQGKRIALDSSHGPYPGWDSAFHPQVTRVKEWNIDGPNWSE